MKLIRICMKKPKIHNLLHRYDTKVCLRVIIIMALVMLLNIDFASADIRQSKYIVSGVVKDNAGELLIGVQVREKDTQTATITDLEGKYTLAVSHSDAVLIFTYMGFNPVETKIQKRKFVDIIMEESLSTLAEVVVIGYGAQSKVSVTGAISTVNSTDIKKSSVASFGNALQGRLAGLSSVQTSGGMPGIDDAEIYLRGAATMNGKTPLILIDGIPRDNIRTVDVNEVESVSVLKDASATAVFGVRGANGVIIITTKRGVQGEAKLSVSASQTYTSFTRQPERLSSLEYIDLRNEAYMNEGLTPAFSADVRAKFENPLLGLDPNDPDYARQAAIRNYLYPDHYYYEEFFKKTAPESRVNANIQGGTDKILYFVNIGYLHQGGHLNTESNPKLNYDPSLKLDRWSFRANMDYKMSDFIKARLNIGTYIEKQNTPNIKSFEEPKIFMNALMQEVLRLNPTVIGPTTIPEVDPNVTGGLAVMPRVGDDPAYELINRKGYFVNTRTNLNTSFELDIDLSKLITKGLSMKAMIAYDSYPTTTLKGTRTEVSYYADGDYNNDKVLYSERMSYESAMTLTRERKTNYKINAQASLNYDRRFGKHTVGGIFLIQRDYWEKTAADIPYNLLGIVGRATYNFDNRYFAEFNVGYNGSEQFAPDNRFGTFPAFSAGWVATNESFFPENEVVTFLKIRGSYGRVGNDQQGSARFLYLDDIQLAGSGIGVGGLGLGQKVNESYIGNKKYNGKWPISLISVLIFNLSKT